METLNVKTMNMNFVNTVFDNKKVSIKLNETVVKSHGHWLNWPPEVQTFKTYCENTMHRS